MGSLPTFATADNGQKPHALCIPYPAQGHITPMMMLAKLLHARYGFHITFVNTEYNHHRLLKSRGADALDGLPGFQFETIPDGLPPTDVDVTQDIPSLCDSTVKNCLPHFRELLAKLLNGAKDPEGYTNNHPTPPVTCVISDGVMSFTLDAAEELGVPEVLFWTPSACGLNAYIYYQELVDRGVVPFSEGQFAAITENLEATVDGIPGMDGIRLRDFPSFIRTTDSGDIMLNFLIRETERARRGKAIILNTFDDLENKFLSAMASVLPPIYSVGPLCLHLSSAKPELDPRVAALGSNLWKEEPQCLSWLDRKAPGSVVYVNFGSITVMTNHQLVEFAWGLANSGKEFLWIIRPDLVRGDKAVLPTKFRGDKAVLPTKFLEETKGRGLMATWCPQEQVLAHPAVGGFLTHSGWNSTLESICSGVPMLCWPFFAEQQTNCRYVCTDWAVGLEINNDVRREVVEDLIIDLMDCPKGNELRANALQWKKRARDAIRHGGSSLVNLDKLVDHVLLTR